MGTCVKLDRRHSSVTRVLVFSLLISCLAFASQVALLHVTENDPERSEV